jgi:anti-anti-sigma factor
MDRTPPRPPIRVAAPAGDIDLHTAPYLEQRLADYPADAVVYLDLSNVTFCDTICLRVLLRALRRHERGGGCFRVENPTTSVLQLLQVSGLEDTLMETGDGTARRLRTP